MQLTNFGQSCTELLEAFAAELTSFGVAVPDAQFVALGMTVADGESLSLYLGGIHQGQPGFPSLATAQPAITTIVHAVLYVQIIRATSGLTQSGFSDEMFPDPSEINADGVVGMTDAAALVRAAIGIHQSKALIENGLGFSIGPCLPLAPLGLLGGTRLEIMVSID